MMKKVKVTETELITIIKTMINEQEEGSEGGGTTGAKTWESGVSRGPANQIAVTKWSEIVGPKISRGKANPLWEDEDYEEYDDDEVDIDLLNESKWYNTFLDFVGVVDPTGVADAINAVSYFRQGDILYGILSLISLVPYVGDAIAKPFIVIMKSGKINTKIINAGLKSGNASKITAEMGKTKAGKAVLETMKNPTTQNFLGNILAKISKIPGFKNFSKDAKTYLNLFTQAAKQSGKIKVFRQSGGLLTRMQRKGLLNRTKLYSKFINHLMGTGVGAAAIEGMGENKLNSKFEEFLNSQDGMDFFNSMNKQDQGDFVDALK